MPQHEHHANPAPSPVLGHLLNPIDSVRFLGMGSANPHWRVEAGGETYVWRQFGPEHASPGADHAREARILATIAHHPWAPVLLAHCPGHGMLFREAPGQHPQAASLSQRQRIALLRTITECWSTTIDEPPRDYVTLVEAYAHRAPPSGQRDELVIALIEACTAWPSEAFRLTHHDLHPGNLLLAGDRWTLIDWEYAALGNPWFDAVALDKMLDLTPAEKSLLVPMLDGAANPERWTAMAQWRSQLNQLWSLARCRQSE